MSSLIEGMSSLIEGLPDEIALRCLAFVPFYLHPKLELVCRSWNAVIRSGKIFKVRQEVGSVEDLLFVCCYDANNRWQFYDPLQDLWITLPRLPTRIKDCFSVVSISQKLFVLGGLFINDNNSSLDNEFSCNEVWSFDPVTRNWSMQAPMLESRTMFACCVLDGKIIVAGGINKKKESTSKVEMYDSENDVWVPLPDLPQTHDSLSGCFAVVIGRKMHFAYKGMPIVQTFDSVECRWRVDDYSWFFNLSSVAFFQDSLYMMRLGFIFKQDGRNDEVVVSTHNFHHMDGVGMIYFRGELYVIGGVRYYEHNYADLSDMHVLTLNSEEPIWYSATSMSRGCGKVLGCEWLRF